MATKKRVGLEDIRRQFETEDECRDYCYRFNRRSMGSEIFNRLLFAVTQSPPLRFADLT